MTSRIWVKSETSSKSSEKKTKRANLYFFVLSNKVEHGLFISEWDQNWFKIERILLSPNTLLIFVTCAFFCTRSLLLPLFFSPSSPSLLCCYTHTHKSECKIFFFTLRPNSHCNSSDSAPTKNKKCKLHKKIPFLEVL